MVPTKPEAVVKLTMNGTRGVGVGIMMVNVPAVPIEAGTGDCEMGEGKPSTTSNPTRKKKNKKRERTETMEKLTAGTPPGVPVIPTPRPQTRIEDGGYMNDVVCSEYGTRVRETFS